ncbi:DegT/DnrJ/EryC1/StrS family aminotransferase [Nakamurella lactea]|uniref:DegT/DnrJ/EryC1/StrS family aminotransferase n=1 Tax=Nakamurella lactea TaxID=459515 RepID=UPI0004144A13|nr:DegT/DnrJ/EryC1/StrS family aminotransferase [Nakamurella lactea]
MNDRRMIQIAAPELSGNESKYVQECLDTTWISSAGRFVKDFEAAFAAFCGADHAVVTNNGTTALHLALAALGVGPGDEVIVPTLTYIASANAVTYCGATPVFADSEPIGMTLDPADVQRKITPRTKAVMPVHLYGNVADMDSINAIAAEAEIAVVEDAAEAHGARGRAGAVGTLGDCASFSFFGNKIITTGEGGAVTTNDAALADRLRLLRGQGMDPQRRYWFPVVGYNYRMTNIAAAIGLAQLEDIDRKIARRRELAAAYDRLLADQPGIRIPVAPPWSESVNWLYTVHLDVDSDGQRDRVIAAMAADRIETRPVFYPMHQMPPYSEPEANYPVADRLAATGISLPTHTQLRDTDIERICERVVFHMTSSRYER